MSKPNNMSMLEALQARCSFIEITNNKVTNNTPSEKKKQRCFTVALTNNNMNHDDSESLYLLATHHQERAMNSQIMQISQHIPDICPLPNAPQFCLGLVNIRGALVPVFDIAAALGATKTSIGQHLLIVGSGKRMAALCIAALPKRLDMNSLSPIAEYDMQHALQDCIQNVFLHKDKNKKQRFILLDMQYALHVLADMADELAGVSIA